MIKTFLNVLCFSFLCIKISAQTIIRGPYLQQPSQTSIVIRWRTDVESTSKIVFGTSKTSLNLTEIAAAKTTEHILKINNLSPETKYFYEVWADNKLVSAADNQFFKTAPKPDSKKPIYFWAGGDFGDISNIVYETNQTQVRDSYVKYSQNFDTDLWLWLGDNGYGGNRDVNLQKSIFDFYGQKIMNHVPFAAALGNHEFDEDPANQQKTRDVHQLKVTTPPTLGEAGGVASNTKAYYSFDYGNTHFINLDSYGMDQGIYRLYDKQGAQYQWLIKDLEANKSTWTIVFFHHPPYTKRSHDSDAEQELKLSRETLVPVFDKYQVDLVLNGHSHIYERSYLIEGHLGHSDSFDPTKHIVNYNQNKALNSGRYLQNEPPIINKTNGTIYVVSGTFGRLEPIYLLSQNNPAHATSYYSNIITGGSLATKIEDNRLDLNWLCADGEIRDRFTMFKNVNKTTKITLEYGNSTNLKASWSGTYVWSNGIKSKKEIDLKPLSSTIITVQDSLGFLQDTFEITVKPQPIIETKIDNSSPICLGKTINGSFEVNNTDFSKWAYLLELSDEKGSFEKPIISKEVSSKTFSFDIPNNLLLSNLYKIRVIGNHPASPDFKINPSENFEIKQFSEGKFLNDSFLPYSQETILKLNFTGSFPIDYVLNFQGITSTSQPNVDIKVTQFEAKNYILESIKNACGEGKISNNKISIAAPLGNELEVKYYKIYPNPVENILQIEIYKKNGNAKIWDLGGKILAKKLLRKGGNAIDISVLPKAEYIVEIEIEGQYYMKKMVKE